MSELMTDRDISQGAPVVVQRATGHERIETYGNSSPIIHSVFHNSVENQAPKMPQALVLCNFPSRNAVDISVEVQEKIRVCCVDLLRTVPILSTFPKQIFEGSANKIPLTSVLKLRPPENSFARVLLCLFRRKCKNSVNKQSRKKTFTNSSCSCRRSITY